MTIAPASIFDEYSTPSAATLLGWTLRAIDEEKGIIEVGFTATDQFLNPAGTIQGGIQTTRQVVKANAVQSASAKG